MNDERAVLAGGTDWIALWRAMQRDVDAARPERAPVEDRWHHRAERFDRRSREPAELPAALADQLRDGDEVLDIGAGTGRHVVLFARRCRRVIAIEPSPAMRARLERRVREEALTNVEILDARWPASGGFAADVVFSSHVLYGAADAAAFLAAMNAASRRVCALQLGVRAPGAALDGLRRHLDGRASPPRPAALEALNVLYQLGFAASLVVVEGSEREFAVGSGEDDVIELCHRLALDPTSSNTASIRDALGVVAPAGAAGMHVLGRVGPNAILSWPVAGARACETSRVPNAAREGGSR